MLKIKRIESDETTVNARPNNFTGYVRIVKSKRKAIEDARKASDNALIEMGHRVWRSK